MVAVVFADGRTLVEVGSAAVDVEPFAAALGLDPPYRLEAHRRSVGLWAVGAHRIRLAELVADPGGDEIELAFDGRERSVTIDGSPTLAGVAELERLGESVGRAYVVTARRLDGRVWEVAASPL